MNDSQYKELLSEIVNNGHNLFFEITAAMEEIKQSDTGMDDRWADLYAMSRLTSVTIDLARAAQNRK